MASKNLVLLVVGHQGYIRHINDEKDYGLENDILFSSISQTYLPLVNMLHKLEQDGVNFKISLVLSPTLCELLADPVIQQQYIEWLGRRIELGEKELVRCKNDADILRNVKECLEQAKENLNDFTEKYSQNLIGEFSEFAKKGFVELVATCGTYAFLPHYGDIPEVLNAQIETGLYSHRHFFGNLPEGFWLPYMGYTSGIEKILHAYGVNYTFIDIHGFFFGKTLPKKGIFSPVRCAEQANSLVYFTQDPDSPEDIGGENGFAANGIYRDQTKDIGFDLNLSDLDVFLTEEGEARIPTGYRYWSKKSSGDNVYDSAAAFEQVKKDAKAFIDAKKEKLSKAAELLGEDVSLVCTIPAKMLGQDWAEGVMWLEQVIRQNSEMNLCGGANCLKDRFSLQKFEPFPSSNTGDGFGENLLDGTNNWMIRYTRKMSERMIDISDRFLHDTGLKIRLLNLGAKELMLAQSGEWAKMLHDDFIPEYAEARFEESIKSFMIVYDSLGSNTVSTEWLTKLERKHTLFPWMNYRVFSPKR